ncbi:MAG: ATP-binding protein, partial [Myxococcota bacterium]|nr:ATP-binding protein [Myxococcota bacterium]
TIKKLEEQLIEAQKFEIMGRLMASTVHNFKNLLFVIMGSTDLLMGDHSISLPQRQRLEAIRQAAGWASGLAQQLMALGRKERAVLVVLDLNGIVNHVAGMLRQLLDGNTGMTITLGEHIQQVKADSGELEQLLLNLVINAQDAMPSGGELTIATSNETLNVDPANAPRGVAPSNYVRISVRDTGTGLAEDAKAHLFEAFYSTKPKGKGTGLGLATCYAIVHQCGGHIQVHSVVGQGTTFDVYLPVANGAPLSARSEEDQSRPSKTPSK